MTSWTMTAPNDSDGNVDILNDRRSSDKPFYGMEAVFDSPADEHYYGLGQNQDGFLDYRGHTIRCWHDYFPPGGERVCVPFLVSSRGYGLVQQTDTDCRQSKKERPSASLQEPVLP